ncbi:MAG: SRPBCC domain-containing protein [Bacteroidia bacterium]|nr:SRPBCC domain-containing protein [Bacteroidia bacterium]
MHTIKHLYHIDSSQSKVFDAVTSVEGLTSWWTTETSGSSEVNSFLEFRFGERWYNKMKVVQLKKDEYVEWECIEGASDWIGTRISFFLDQNENKTRVRFAHSLWMDNGDFFAICNFTWGRYLQSLRNYCQTGEGAPFGSPQFKI